MLSRQICSGLLSAVLLAGCSATPHKPAAGKALVAAEANTRLGIEYMRSGEYDMARKRLEKAVRQAPDFPDAHDAIAVLYEQVGEPELAEQHYRKSLRLDPDRASARNNYGRFLCQSKRYGEAEEAFRQAADNTFYRSPWVPLTNAGICLMGVPDHGRAEEYFRRALKLQPGYAPALMKMAEISFADGNYLRTRAYLQRYQQAAEHTAESLWLAIRTEFMLHDHQAWGNYAVQLENRFPDSEQYTLLQEWENERRSGN